MAQILLLYSSTDGHTLKICQRLKQEIEQKAHKVSVVSITDCRQLDLSSFDTIVIGASIRYGRHRPWVSEFINNNLQLLKNKPNAFFSVNIVARKPDKNQPETNPYLQKFLTQINWRPRLLAVFAGKLDYPSYRMIDRWMIRLIMMITGGPTDPTTVIEYTDWKKVEGFARQISEM